jgi:hypothetical protein
MSFYDKLLKNTIVLNIVALLAFLNIIGYVVISDYDSVIYFILLGYLTSFFSKNMIIVLMIPLIIVNLFTNNSIISATLSKLNLGKEGMETKQNKNNGQNNNAQNNNAQNNNAQNKIKEIKKLEKASSSTTQGLPITPIEDTTTIDETFEVGKSKKNGYNIDYASTIEDAYDHLNQILGSDGIKRLTDDTQSLMKQQMQLAESMKQMGPLIQGMAPLMEQAKGLLGSMGSGDNGLGNLVNMAKQFTAGQK